MIEIKNLNKTYDKKSRNANHVLRDISLTLPDTGFVCIVGTSGCGKTSLLNAIGGLDTFDNGTIATQNTTVSKSGTREYEQERNNSFSYIFQNYYLLSDHSVAYNVYLGLHSLALSHKERLARVKEALAAVNMSRYARRIVGELSGGQQQRVAIARALARRPRVIFADEPTGNLDEENTRNICTLLRKISKTSLVVMVTHEEHIARFFADRIITLGDGKILSDEDGWKRGNLEGGVGSTLYTQDYE
ncbi:MAG: ABC transporter ATP-binding protein, partial [Lachnospiraceae bacterium]|nr:ABC transporter ATP-binding protein [Lachnospiraceae bacterium]